MRPVLLIATVLCASAVNLACDPDNCADLPPSFHLDVEFEDREQALQISALRVDVTTPQDRFRRIFEVADTLSDTKTSLGVLLEPAPTEEIEITVNVAAYTTTSTIGQAAAQSEDTFDLDPNGCNRYRFELEFRDP